MSNDNKKENLIINNEKHLDSYLELSNSISMTLQQLDEYIEDKL